MTGFTVNTAEVDVSTYVEEVSEKVKTARNLYLFIVKIVVEVVKVSVVYPLPELTSTHVEAETVSEENCHLIVRDCPGKIEEDLTVNVSVKPTVVVSDFGCSVMVGNVLKEKVDPTEDPLELIALTLKK